MIERVRSLIWTFSLFFLGACSSMSELDLTSSRRSEYESYLDKNLKTSKLYLKLSEIASAKVLMVTPELSQLQASVVPGFEIKTQDTKSIFVLSLEMPDWSRFSISDFKFYWGESPALSVKEIMDGQLLQTLYPFSVPHDRAFILEFDSATSAPLLRVQTSQGQFSFNYGSGS